MFGYKKRIKDLETKVRRQGYDIIYLTNRLNAKINCLQDRHEYELKDVGVGVGSAKVCKHCDKTINLEEAKED